MFFFSSQNITQKNLLSPHNSLINSPQNNYMSISFNQPKTKLTITIISYLTHNLFIIKFLINQS